MAKNLIQDGKVGIFFKGKNPETEQAFAAVAGINIKKQELVFLSAIGAESLKKLRLPSPRDKPHKLRQKIIDNKISTSQRGGQFLIKDADRLFQNFFDKHLDRLIGLLAEGQKMKAREFIKNTFKNKIIENKNTSLDVHFLKFSEAVKTGDGKSEERNRSRTKKQGQSTSTPPKTSSGKSVPVSPMIGVKDGIKVSNAQPGDRIRVKLAEKAVQKLEEKTTDSKQRKKLRKPRNASVLEFNPTGEGEGQLRVELDEGIIGSCTVSTGSLLKPGKETSKNFDQYETNIEVIIWFLVICIVIIAAVSIMFLF